MYRNLGKKYEVWKDLRVEWFTFQHGNDIKCATVEWFRYMILKIVVLLQLTILKGH